VVHRRQVSGDLAAAIRPVRCRLHRCLAGLPEGSQLVVNALPEFVFVGPAGGSVGAERQAGAALHPRQVSRLILQRTGFLFQPGKSAAPDFRAVLGQIPAVDSGDPPAAVS
jgi:hypothetical protein